jgi:hypothetical protein
MRPGGKSGRFSFFEICAAGLAQLRPFARLAKRARALALPVIISQQIKCPGLVKAAFARRIGERFPKAG